MSVKQQAKDGKQDGLLHENYFALVLPVCNPVLQVLQTEYFLVPDIATAVRMTAKTKLRWVIFPDF